MLEHSKPDELVLKLLPKQKYDSGIKYRFPAFVMIIEQQGNLLAFNTLTRMLVELNEVEYNDLINSKNLELQKQCVENYFLLPYDYDDFALINQIKQIMRNIDRANIDRFVILTTTDCNARCFYCFEYGVAKKNMTTKTAGDVADYIIKKSKNKKVKLDWFGGEPLFNSEAIDIICNTLKNADVEYNSSMISNGYLFNEQMIDSSVNLWNLSLVQITIDGTERIYNSSKNYIYGTDESPFKIVINNIKNLVKSGINVIIRMNLGEHNKADLFDLINYLSAEYDGYQDYITMYVWLLYDDRGITKKIKTDDERHSLLLTLYELEDLISEKGFSTKSTVRTRLTTQVCYANDDRSLIILPDGKLGKCDHSLDDNLIGDIYNDTLDTKVINAWKETREPIELCKTCPLFPQCVNIKLCHDDGAYDCDEFEQKKKINKLKKQIINTYNKHKYD